MDSEGVERQFPKVVVRPPAEDVPPRGKDEVEIGWGGEDDRPRGAEAEEAEFRRRHSADRPPHHDSDWG